MLSTEAAEVRKSQNAIGDFHMTSLKFKHYKTDPSEILFHDV